MKYIEKQVLLELNRRLSIKDRILLHICKRYTYAIYKLGYQDGFNFKL